MGFLEEVLDFLRGGVLLFGEIEGGDCGFEVLGVELGLRLVEEAVEGVGI